MLRWGILPLAIGLGLLSLAALAFVELEPTTLRVAVAPRDGTEPELLAAFATALAAERQDLRLQLTVYDDLRDSAKALETGQADLAVVRPDIALPINGLTVAVLRDQALMIVSPAKPGITSVAALGGKRLGIVMHREADSSLLQTVLATYRLTLRNAPDETKPPASEVWWVSLPEEDVTAALRAHRIDAVLAVISPTAPRASQVVSSVVAASPNGKAVFVTTDDQDALVERFPLLQDVTLPAGLFGGRPKVPTEDVKTLGASYRLMARVSLSRTVVATLTQHLFEMRPRLARATPAAYYMAAPNYDTTVAATSARLPNHPGAIDYYERDQHGFIDRYSDTLYLLALVGSGVGSVIAWARQRLSRLRKERIEEITDRLLDIVSEAGGTGEPATLAALSDEIEALAVDAARWARDHEPSQRITMAMSLALDTARQSIARRRESATPSGTRSLSGLSTTGRSSGV